MKHAYYVLSVDPDGHVSTTPDMSLKSAKVFERNLEACSLPGWRRYIVVREVSI